MGIRGRSRIVFCICFLTALLATAWIFAPASPAQPAVRPPVLLERLDAFDIERPEATAFSIWNASRSQRHEVWFRILGGDALFQQRLRVYKEQALPRSPDTLPPRSELMHEIEGNQTTDWVFLGSERAFHTYYFDGDNRPISGAIWDNSKAVRTTATSYRNGDLYEIRFEDLNTLDDYNDLEVEVVLIRD